MEESQEFISRLQKKKFENDADEAQLANFYYSIEDVEKRNENGNLFYKQKDLKTKKELLRKMLSSKKKAERSCSVKKENNFRFSFENFFSYNKNNNFYSNNDKIFESEFNYGFKNPSGKLPVDKLKSLCFPNQSLNFYSKNFHAKAVKLQMDYGNNFEDYVERNLLLVMIKKRKGLLKMNVCALFF